MPGGQANKATNTGARTQQHNYEEQVAAVELVAQISYQQRRRRAHRKKGRRHIAAQIPAAKRDADVSAPKVHPQMNPSYPSPLVQ